MGRQNAKLVMQITFLVTKSGNIYILCCFLETSIKVYAMLHKKKKFTGTGGAPHDFNLPLINQ